jgi:hypothetical protein
MQINETNEEIEAKMRKLIDNEKKAKCDTAKEIEVLIEKKKSQKFVTKNRYE